MKYYYEVNRVRIPVTIEVTKYANGTLRINLVKPNAEKIELTYNVQVEHPERTAYVALNKFGTFIEEYKLGVIGNEIEFLPCGWYTLVKFNEVIE